MHPRSAPIVGIHGRLRSGKTTFATQLRAHIEEAYHEKRCQRLARIVAFADGLKRIAREMGWDGQKDARGRRLLQHLGTEVGRGYNENVWVAMWERDIQGLLHNRIIICDDMRFSNEFNRIREMGGLCIKIKRDEAEPSLLQRLPWRQHASERPLPDELFDIVIENNDGLTQLDVHAIKLSEMLIYYHGAAKTKLAQLPVPF